MSSDEPCKGLTVKRITRDIIKYLDSGVDLDNVKPSEVLAYLSESNHCTLSKEEKVRARKIMKEAYNTKQEGDWSEYKAKSRKRSRSKSPKKKSPSPKRSSRSPARLKKSDIGELEALGEDNLTNLITMVSGKTTLKTIQTQLAKLGVTRLGGASIYKIPKDRLVEIILKASLRAEAAPIAVLPSSSPAHVPVSGIVDCNSRANTISSLLEYIEAQGWPAPGWKDKKTKTALCAYIASKEGSLEEKIPEYAPAPIIPAVSERKGPEDYENCAKSRKLTIQKIRDWADVKGWSGAADYPKPTAKKAVWCSWLQKYVDADSLPAAAPEAKIPEPTILKGSEPEDYKNCEKSRKLTIQKIRDWADVRGWSGAEDYPKPTAKKAIWCSWLQKYVDAEKLAVAPPRSKPRAFKPKLPKPVILPPVPEPIPEPILPEVPEPILPPPRSCGTKPDFATLEEFEEDYRCPPGTYCDIDNKVCGPVPGTGMETVEIPLSGGRTVTVTGYPKNLTTLRDKIASKTRQPIPAVISPPITLPEIRIPPSAPEPEILSTSPPRRKPKVGKTVNFIAENPEEEARNMARLRQLIGKGSGEEKEREIKIAENIEDLKSAELAALQEAQVLAEARVIEEEKLAVPWSAPELLEEKVPIRRAPERAIIEAARTQAPRPVIIEEREPSEVTRLVARLRDIQAVPQSTPVRLIGAQHALADKIALCTGISP